MDYGDREYLESVGIDWDAHVRAVDAVNEFDAFCDAHGLDPRNPESHVYYDFHLEDIARWNASLN